MCTVVAFIKDQFDFVYFDMSSQFILNDLLILEIRKEEKEKEET